VAQFERNASTPKTRSFDLVMRALEVARAHGNEGSSLVAKICGPIEDHRCLCGGFMGAHEGEMCSRCGVEISD